MAPESLTIARFSDALIDLNTGRFKSGIQTVSSNYDVGWLPSHGENGGVGKKKKRSVLKWFGFRMVHFQNGWDYSYCYVLEQAI